MKDHSVKIIIATHKEYEMPEDNMYIPLQVGAEGKTDEQGNPLELGYVKDNTGDNISIKNPNYCELTGLYWAWKNLDADYLGLVHYRRHFQGRRKGETAFDKVLTSNGLKSVLGKYKVFVPKKRHYYIETLYTHYQHTHYKEHLDYTREIIGEKYPDYVDVYDKVVNRTYGYMFNMMIMEKSLFSDYCKWLFDILEELENKVDASELSYFQGRFYGRVSEIIFNVWLEYQLENGVVSKEEIKELPYIYMEPIKWNKKIISFLQAKFMHKRYEGSF